MNKKIIQTLLLVNFSHIYTIAGINQSKDDSSASHSNNVSSVITTDINQNSDNSRLSHSNNAAPNNSGMLSILSQPAVSQNSNNSGALYILNRAGISQKQKQDISDNNQQLAQESQSADQASTDSNQQIAQDQQTTQEQQPTQESQSADQASTDSNQQTTQEQQLAQESQSADQSSADSNQDPALSADEEVNSNPVTNSINYVVKHSFVPSQHVLKASTDFELLLVHCSPEFSAFGKLEQVKTCSRTSYSEDGREIVFSGPTQYLSIPRGDEITESLLWNGSRLDKVGAARILNMRLLGTLVPIKIGSTSAEGYYTTEEFQALMQDQVNQKLFREAFGKSHEDVSPHVLTERRNNRMKLESAEKELNIGVNQNTPYSIDRGMYYSKNDFQTLMQDTAKEQLFSQTFGDPNTLVFCDKDIDQLSQAQIKQLKNTIFQQKDSIGRQKYSETDLSKLIDIELARLYISILGIKMENNFFPIRSKEGSSENYYPRSPMYLTQEDFSGILKSEGDRRIFEFAFGVPYNSSQLDFSKAVI